jgi:hypothetical protein
MLAWALAYASVGMAVVPVAANKKPLTPHGLKDATTDGAVIRTRGARWPCSDQAWALPADIVVLDLDIGKGGNGFRDFAAHEGKGAETIETPQASTPAGGRHLIYAATGAAHRNGVRVNGSAIDIRTAGGYVVLPGLANGRAWLKPLSTPLAPAPDWARPAERQRSAAPAKPRASPFVDMSLRAIARRVERATEGERNKILFWAACRFGELARDGLLDEAWAAELLTLAASRAGLPDLEARRTIQSGFRTKSHG